ncbi:MAG: vitamin-B12 independent methionine synthase [Gordonia sp. (in: high G+C Gram-positive bacteria)]
MNRMPTGVGTGAGSMPGTDPAAAAAIVNGELDLAHLPVLPARGIGADLIGRMAAILVDLPIDSSTWGYRLGAKGSSVTRRARGFLSADLDAVEEIWDGAGFLGMSRPFTVTAAGPFTLAASLELPNGHKVIRDRGAWRDLAASAAEGLGTLVGDLRRRLGAQVLLQLDEPLVGAVLDGAVTPLTRLDPIAPLPAPEVADVLASVIAQVGVPAILRGGATPRWELADRLPGVAQSVDVRTSTLPTATFDGIGRLIERGDVLVAGVLDPARVGAPLDTETLALRVAAVTDRIGLPRKVLSDNVIVTPTTGLADVSAAWATRVLAACAKTGELLATDPDAL